MFSFNCKGRLYTFPNPVVMGILNSTPDSFFAGSRNATVDAALQRAEQMISDGATFIDIGGQSTRPGSQRISEEEEKTRVLPVVDAIASRFPDVLLSIDTFYAGVAREAIHAGAHLVNDVSAGTIDADLLPAVAALQIPYVLMHMQGNPQVMQQNPTYENVVAEVFDFLNTQLQMIYQLGIKDILVDPGLGFGKTAIHNLQLLKQLSFFNQLGKPILVGLSRKATVYKTLGVTADEALSGTTVLNTIALLNGAAILRVHDVKEAMQAITLTEVYKTEKAAG